MIWKTKTNYESWEEYKNKIKCNKCKLYGVVSEKLAQLYEDGMLCNCGGKVEVTK